MPESFLWRRRSRWRKSDGTRSIFNLDKPMDVAAVLIPGTAATESATNEKQRKLIAATEKYFEKMFVTQDKWNTGATCQ